MKIVAVALIAVGALTLGACSNDNEPMGLNQAVSDRAPAPSASPIAQIAIDAGFSELVGALQYVDTELNTGLVELFMNGRGQYTVFAPTNTAFQNLYSLLGMVLGVPVNGITDLPADVVLQVLQYHVAAGRRSANSVVPPVNDRTIVPLLGEKFQVRANGTIEDGLTVLGVRPDAAIVSADISARNGVVHVVDQVIVPPSVVAALTN